jgi:hypothetical protein
MKTGAFIVQRRLLRRVYRANPSTGTGAQGERKNGEPFDGNWSSRRAGCFNFPKFDTSQSGFVIFITILLHFKSNSAIF